ncbi:MAG: hypothetical protein HY744_11780 [Deltaproteobacteria bacterium]|nr:hypothetical protein [Deltaproteobacteria bacterium]
MVQSAEPLVRASGDTARLDPRRDQIRVLRSLAARIERGEPLLPAELEKAVASELEDRIDMEAADAAQAEPCESIPYEQVRKELGLDRP